MFITGEVMGEELSMKERKLLLTCFLDEKDVDETLTDLEKLKGIDVKMFNKLNKLYEVLEKIYK